MQSDDVWVDPLLDLLDPDNVANEDIVYMLEEGLRRVKVGWCYYTNARDYFGKVCWPDSQHATCWCAAGAILGIHPASTARRVQYIVNLQRLCFEILTIPLDPPEDVHPDEWTHEGQLTQWNDTDGRTQEEVVELYETALIFARNPPPPPEPTPAQVVGSEGFVHPMVAWIQAMRDQATAEGREPPDVPYWFGGMI